MNNKLFNDKCHASLYYKLNFIVIELYTKQKFIDG